MLLMLHIKAASYTAISSLQISSCKVVRNPRRMNLLLPPIIWAIRLQRSLILDLPRSLRKSRAGRGKLKASWVLQVTWPPSRPTLLSAVSAQCPMFMPLALFFMKCLWAGLPSWALQPWKLLGKSASKIPLLLLRFARVFLKISKPFV